MKVDNSSVSENNKKVLKEVIQRENQENISRASIAKETLAKLNIKSENLPQNCQQLLKNISSHYPNIQDLDPISISLRTNEKTNIQLAAEYDILKLKQKNRELAIRIDKNKKVLEDLRRELKEAKSSLAAKQVNPDNVQEKVRQLSLKVASYEESYEKSKARFAKNQVPDSLMPKSLEVLINQLASLKEEEVMLKDKADEVLFTRNMRDTFNRLRK